MSLRTDLLKAQDRTEGIIVTLISLGLAVIAIMIFIFLLSFADVNYSINEIFDNAFVGIIIKRNGDLNLPSLFDALRWSLPLVLTGLSVAIAFRVGAFNIGGQGQMILGGVWAGIWAAYLVPETPFLQFLNTPILIIPSTILVGIFAGAIWGGIPGALKAYTGAHEVITTILMNFVAIEFAFFLVGSNTAPFVDQTLGGDAYGQTGPIAGSARIDPINSSINTFLSWTILFVILAVIVMYFVIWRTNLGYKIRAVGFSNTAALAAGMDSKKLTVIAMLIAGGLSGLAGAIGVIGIPPYRYIFRSEGTAGFDGIAVALIGQNNPLPILFVAIFFGFLAQGMDNLDIKTNIPSELIVTLQSVVILFVAAPVIARGIYNKFKQIKDIDELRTKWSTYNREQYAKILLYLIPLILILGLILFPRIIVEPFSIIMVILGEILGLTVVLSQLIIATMPMTALFVLLMPIIYVSSKISQSRDKSQKMISKRSLIYVVVILFALVEGFILSMFVLSNITGTSANFLTFHYDVLREIISTLTLKDMLRLGFPIMFAALGATFNERAGVINIGLEGILLFSAWGAAFFTFASGEPFIGIIGGIFFGLILGSIHAIFSITLKAEQIVTGVALNLLALGLTDLFTFVVWDQRGASPSLKKLPKFLLKDIPILGKFIDSLQFKNYYKILVFGDIDIMRLIPDPLAIINNQSVLLLLGFLLIPFCHYLLFHTKYGLRLRVIGEEPNTAATAGIPVRRYQYMAVLFSAFLASLGGIFLSIGDQSKFVSMMSGGKGFVGLAAMIFGKWTVIGSVLSSLFFGYFFSLSISIKLLIPTVSSDIFDVAPFIIAILTLAGAIGRARPPKSIGKPYDPQEE